MLSARTAPGAFGLRRAPAAPLDDPGEVQMTEKARISVLGEAQAEWMSLIVRPHVPFPRFPVSDAECVIIRGSAIDRE